MTRKQTHAAARKMATSNKRKGNGHAEHSGGDRDAAVFRQPAWAADEHSKVLTDTATNLATANWKVTSRGMGPRAARPGACSSEPCMAAARKACR